MTDMHTIVLALDGRYVSLGRHTAPTDDEVQRAADALASQGVTAWLATMSGSAYGKRAPKLSEVRLLTGAGSFTDAVAAFNSARTP